MTNTKAVKAKTVFTDEMSMEVNSDKATMMSKIDHDEKKGTVKLTFTLTTRHISFNPDIEAAVLNQLQKLASRTYGDAKDVLKAWIDHQNEIPGTPQIPFPGEPKAEQDNGEEKAEQAVDDDATAGSADSEAKSPVKSRRSRVSKVVAK